MLYQFFLKEERVLEEYKSNSNKARDGSVEPVKNNKIVPVVSGHAELQKKKILGGVVSSDLRTVGSFLLTDVLLPNFKRVLSDLVVNGMDMLLYGKSGVSKRTGASSKVSYGGSSVSYSSYYNKSYEEPVRAGSSSVGVDYDNVVFETRGDAEAVKEVMEDLLDQYGMVRVSDFYELAEIPTSNYTLNNYGWTSLKGTQVIACRDGFILKLPKIVPLQ